MKKFIFAGMLALLPLGSLAASTDYYLKLDGVEGEASTSAPATAQERSGPATNVAADPTTGAAGTAVTQPNQTDLNFTTAPSSATGGTEDINIGVGEAQQKGNVEYGWKVEEGESAAGPAFLEIDTIRGESPEAESDKASDRLKNAGPVNGWPISVSAVEVRGWDAEKKQALMATVKTAAEVKSEQDLQNFAIGVMLAEDQPAETLSLNFEEIKFTHAVPGKFLGLFAVSLKASTEVDSRYRVKVRLPWYSFLFSKPVKAADIEQAIGAELTANAGQADGEGEADVSWSFEAQAQAVQTISNVLKTKHDTAKNSIGNIR